MDDCQAKDALFGRRFVVDLELAGDTSMLTVYESDVPRLKTSMTQSEVERLLTAMTEFSASKSV